ncbi:hypothetical protein V1264_009284 [Littorina saxatilis]
MSRKKHDEESSQQTNSSSIALNEPDIISRWSVVGTSEGISSNEEVATFLLNLYFHEKNPGTKKNCKQCNGLLALFCAKCQLFAEQESSPQSSSLLLVKKEGGKSSLHSKVNRLKVSSQKTAVLSSGGDASSSNCLQSDTDSPCQDGTSTTNQVDTSTTNQAAESSIGNNSSHKSEPDPTKKDGVDLTKNDVTDMDDSNSGDQVAEDASDDSDSSHDNDDGGRVAETLDSSFKTDFDSDGEEAVDSGEETFTSNGEPAVPVCPLCREVFKTSQECKSHFGSHDKLISNGEGAYYCKACTRTYPRFKALYRHMRLTTSQQRCPECDHLFSSRCEIARHQRKHSKEKDRYCYQCEKPYPGLTKKEFVAHVKRHFREGSRDGGSEQGFLCSNCGKIFKKKDDLKGHMTYHNKDSPFVCTFPPCTKAFKNKGCLRQHLLTHKEKMQQCEICGSKFARKCGLRRHMQKHYGKEFCCSECSHRFCSKNELVTHVRTVHLGIRRHPCTICGVKLSTSTNLLKHTRTHTGEKPYSCGECPSRFSMKHALLRHMRRHTGEKPYQCEDCGQKYSCLKSYKLHRRKYHSENKYRCACGLEFEIQTSLAFHAKMCHDENVKSELVVKSDDTINIINQQVGILSQQDLQSLPGKSTE